MERILVIGGNGSGKSTFSVQLGEKLGLPIVHLDRIFWKGNWESVSREAFDALLLAELEKPQWIIDGHYGRTIPLRLQYCDMVFFLDFSRARCLWGSITRIIKNYGTTRPDMGENCPERFDWEFLKGVWTLMSGTGNGPTPGWRKPASPTWYLKTAGRSGGIWIQFKCTCSSTEANCATIGFSWSSCQKQRSSSVTPMS